MFLICLNTGHFSWSLRRSSRSASSSSKFGLLHILWMSFRYSLSILPRNRLLVWVALIGLPFALLGALEPKAAALSLTALGTLGFLALLDAFSARGALSGISIQLPEIVRMSKDREGKLELRIGNERAKPYMLRIGLPLPREIESEQEDVQIALPAGSEWSRFNW